MAVIYAKSRRKWQKYNFVIKIKVTGYYTVAFTLHPNHRSVETVSSGIETHVKGSRRTNVKSGNMPVNPTK